MAHINYIRNVLHTGRQSLEALLPQDHRSASFAAFCGDPGQRRAVGLRGIRRCCGHVGIVVLQNDPLLAGSLGRLREDIPGLARSCPWFRTYSVNPAGAREHFYDPLYGLPKVEVLDAIAPTDAAGYGMVSAFDLRAHLAAYLEIMELQFRRDPTPFGNYPYNLDLLLQLTQMPLDRLEHSVIAYLPQTEGRNIFGQLSQNDAQQRVYAAVSAFAQEMGAFLWTRRGFVGHTRASIVDAVRQRCVISVTVPSPRPAVLHYIYQELKALQEARQPFLLVTDGVPLSGSPELRRMFTDPHENACYSTGILAGDLSHVLGENTVEVASLLAEHHEVLVFACASVQQAAPFSEALGTYQRMVEEEHYDRHRQPFHIFSSHGYGTGIREVTEHNVNARELLELGDGAVLCGSLHIPPVMIRRVIL